VHVEAVPISKEDVAIVEVLDGAVVALALIWIEIVCHPPILENRGLPAVDRDRILNHVPVHDFLTAGSGEGSLVEVEREPLCELGSKVLVKVNRCVFFQI